MQLASGNAIICHFYRKFHNMYCIHAEISNIQLVYKLVAFNSCGKLEHVWGQLFSILRSCGGSFRVMWRVILGHVLGHLESCVGSFRVIWGHELGHLGSFSVIWEVI